MIVFEAPSAAAKLESTMLAFMKPSPTKTNQPFSTPSAKFRSQPKRLSSQEILGSSVRGNWDTKAFYRWSLIFWVALNQMDQILNRAEFCKSAHSNFNPSSLLPQRIWHALDIPFKLAHELERNFERGFDIGFLHRLVRVMREAFG